LAAESFYSANGGIFAHAYKSYQTFLEQILRHVYNAQLFMNTSSFPFGKGIFRTETSRGVEFASDFRIETSSLSRGK